MYNTYVKRWSMRTVNSSLRKPKNMVLQDVSKAEPQPVSVGQTSLRIMVHLQLGTTTREPILKNLMIK